LNLQKKSCVAAIGDVIYDADHTRRSVVTILAGSILTIDPHANGVARNIQANYKTAAEALQNSALVKVNLPGGGEGYRVVADITDLSVAGSAVIVTGKPGKGWDKWIIDEEGHRLHGHPRDDLRA
jgi:hypothetical protein